MESVPCLLQGKILTVSSKTVVTAIDREAERSYDPFLNASFSGNSLVGIFLHRGSLGSQQLIDMVFEE